MAGNVELRTALQEAVTLAGVQQYKAMIEELRSMYGHNITVLQHDYNRWKRGPEPICFGFAFGLPNDAQYLEVVKAGRGGRQDMVRPLEAGPPRILRRRQANARNGDVVLYFRDGA